MLDNKPIEITNDEVDDLLNKIDVFFEEYHNAKNEHYIQQGMLSYYNEDLLGFAAGTVGVLVLFRYSKRIFSFFRKIVQFFRDLIRKLREFINMIFGIKLGKSKSGGIGPFSGDEVEILRRFKDSYKYEDPSNSSLIDYFQNFYDNNCTVSFNFDNYFSKVVKVIEEERNTTKKETLDISTAKALAFDELKKYKNGNDGQLSATKNNVEELFFGNETDKIKVDSNFIQKMLGCLEKYKTQLAFYDKSDKAIENFCKTQIQKGQNGKANISENELEGIIEISAWIFTTCVKGLRNSYKLFNSIGRNVIKRMKKNN